MTSPNTYSSEPSPETNLYNLLPNLTENISPQTGYRLELSSVLLSDIDPSLAKDHRRIFQRVLEASITNEATFVYTFEPTSQAIELVSIRFGLQRPKQNSDGTVAADCIYLQNSTLGFVSTLGLGEDTVADTPMEALQFDKDAIKRLLDPFGLYTLPQGNQLKLGVTQQLDRSDAWTVKEQRTIPLPAQSEREAINQLIITRMRSRTKLPGEDNSGYHDDCELTVQAVNGSAGATNSLTEKRIEEVTMKVLTDYHSPSGRPLIVVQEREYTRYDHPFVLGLSEITEIGRSTREPTNEDYLWYTALLERYAA